MYLANIYSGDWAESQTYVGLTFIVWAEKRFHVNASVAPCVLGDEINNYLPTCGLLWAFFLCMIVCSKGTEQLQQPTTHTTTPQIPSQSMIEVD